VYCALIGEDHEAYNCADLFFSFIVVLCWGF